MLADQCAARDYHGRAAESEPNHRPQEAPDLSGEICFAGTLVEKPDQDHWHWEV